MKKLRMLSIILKQTRASKILLGFIGFFFLIAALLCLAEPEITTYREAVWFCCSVIFTTGFGDITPVTILGRALSVLLSCYALFALAIVTGVVVAYFTDSMHTHYAATRLPMLEKLERLPELSQEELRDLSETIKKMR